MEIWILHPSSHTLPIAFQTFHQCQRDGLKKIPAYKQARYSDHMEKIQNWAGNLQAWLLIFGTRVKSTLLRITSELGQD